MVKPLPKSNYPTEMLYFRTEHTLVIYVQFIIYSKRKPSSLLEKIFEDDSEFFVLDIIFKCLKFEYSSSETVSNQQIKLRAILLVTAYSWRSD